MKGSVKFKPSHIDGFLDRTYASTCIIYLKLPCFFIPQSLHCLGNTFEVGDFQLFFQLKFTSSSCEKLVK